MQHKVLKILNYFENIFYIAENQIEMGCIKMKIFSCRLGKWLNMVF